MPAKGKHRRPGTVRLTRSIAVVGTGGAALALPLFGATAANATAQLAQEGAVQSGAATSGTTDGVNTRTDRSDGKDDARTHKDDTRTYTVKGGDHLAKIARSESVDGGWKQLYADNRETVGSDPSLIHPGLKLSVDGASAAADGSREPSSAGNTSPSSEAPSSTSKTTPTGESSEQSASESSSGAAQADQATNVTGYSPPVPGGALATGYRAAGDMWSSGYHTGVDFVVPAGTSLKSVGAGTVVSAGWAGSYGNQVVVKLNDGYYAQYAHLSSLSVSAGQTVGGGQQVGFSGSTGNSTGPHLHFEIRTTPDYGSDMDPVAYLRGKGVFVG